MASAMSFRYSCDRCSANYGLYEDYLQHCTVQHVKRQPTYCVSFNFSLMLCPLCCSRIVESSGSDETHQITIILCDKCQVTNRKYSPELKEYGAY